MESMYELLATNMAHENDIPFATAAGLVLWLEAEGILDYDILKEVYSEPEADAPRLRLVETEARDAAIA